MLKSMLEKAYLATTYSVFIEHRTYNIKIGQPLPTVIQSKVKQEKSAAIITAWNPQSQALSQDENTARSHKLKSQLEKFIVFNALGICAEQTQNTRATTQVWPAEESFFILGISKQEAELLAFKYQQYAYVWLEKVKIPSLEFTEIWFSHNDN